jgi:hypothetical protein
MFIIANRGVSFGPFGSTKKTKPFQDISCSAAHESKLGMIALDVTASRVTMAANKIRRNI